MTLEALWKSFYHDCKVMITQCRWRCRQQQCNVVYHQIYFLCPFKKNSLSTNICIHFAIWFDATLSHVAAFLLFLNLIGAKRLDNAPREKCNGLLMDHYIEQWYISFLSIGSISSSITKGDQISLDKVIALQGFPLSLSECPPSSWKSLSRE